MMLRFHCLPLLLLALAAGCSRPEKPLRVGSSVWPGYAPLYLAKHLNQYPENIRVVDFPSATDVARAYRDGLIDAATLTLDEALLATQGEGEHRIILVCENSMGADAILARPGLASVSDLRGRRVGVETTALGAYVLARALQTAKMQPTDVEVVHLPILEHEKAFQSGRVEAVVTFDPPRARLVARGAVTLFDSRQIPGEIIDVIVTRAVAHPSTPKLVSGWFHALDWLRAHPEPATHVLAQLTQMSPAELQASLDLISRPGREENARLLAGESPTVSNAMGQLITFFQASHGQIHALALDPTFVRP